VLLQIGAADPVLQVGGEVGDDVIDRFGHRREGVVGSKDDMVVAENLQGCIQDSTVVRQ
jgi:hypothetical protein